MTPDKNDFTPAPAPGAFPPSPPPPPQLLGKGRLPVTAGLEKKNPPTSFPKCNEYTAKLGDTTNKPGYKWMDLYAMPLLLPSSSYWSDGGGLKNKIVLQMRVWMIAQGFNESSVQAATYNNIWNLQTDAANCPKQAWVKDRPDYACTDPSRKITPPPGWPASKEKPDPRTGQMVTYYYCNVKVCVPQYDSVTSAADGYVEFTAKLGLKNKSWQKLHDDLLNQQPDFRTFVQDLKIFGGLHYDNSQLLASKLISAGKILAAYLDDRIALYDKSIACIESSGGLKSRSEELKQEKAVLDEARRIAREMK